MPISYAFSTSKLIRKSKVANLLKSSNKEFEFCTNGSLKETINFDRLLFLSPDLFIL